MDSLDKDDRTEGQVGHHDGYGRSGLDLWPWRSRSAGATLTLIQVRKQRLELRRQLGLAPLLNPHTTTTTLAHGSDGLFPCKP